MADLPMKPKFIDQTALAFSAIRAWRTAFLAALLIIGALVAALGYIGPSGSGSLARMLPVLQVTNLVRAIEMLKEAGLWIAGLDVQGSRSIYESDLTVPMGLVVGNEQKGIRPLIRKACDLIVQIPPFSPMDSLNAATAGAVALAEVQRQRTTSGKTAGFRKEQSQPE